MSELSIGLILPDVLGTYGDDGSTLVLRQRARMHGIDAEIVPIKLGDAVPTDLGIYTVGGGEDVARTIAVEHPINDGSIRKATGVGKQILAICAGFQIFDNSFRVGGRDVAGLNLVDRTTGSLELRTIGEVCTLADPTNGLLDSVGASPLTGFENHMGRMTLSTDAKPLGRVARGAGNTGPEAEQAGSGIAPGVNVSSLTPTGDVEDVVQGSIICTYLYEPVLARNSQLADLLLARATNQDLLSLAPLDPEVVDKLREERILSKPRPKNER